jgi:hypothetical protein
MASCEIKIKFDEKLIEVIRTFDRRLKKIEKELSRLTGRKI